MLLLAVLLNISVNLRHLGASLSKCRFSRGEKTGDDCVVCGRLPAVLEYRPFCDSPDHTHGQSAPEHTHLHMEIASHVM